MTEYINKDFYKQIPANERHFIKLSQEAAYAAVKELEAANIPHSATISEYRSVVTVNRVDSVNAERIAEKAAKEFPNVKKVFGNTEYKAIRDRKYIDTDADTARKIAALLSGNTNNRFSGIIRGEKATITVSGEKNAAAVRAMVENLKNLDLLEALRERGYERTADTNGFVNIRNIQTGETCGFNGMAAVRDMFDNPENEFFYPLSYRVAYRENPANGDYYYYVQKYNFADKSSAKAYRDENNKPAIFKSIDEALSYTAKNGIKISNIDEEIANWRDVDREREDNSIIEENRKLIENFQISGGNYVDLIGYNSNTDTFSWVYFNPDGDNGSGEFVDKTVTKEDIFAAYSLRIAAENEEQGRNRFIAYLNENCKENVIELHSGYFAEYAGDYINYASKNYAYFFGIAENSTATSSMDNFITHLELNCEEVIKDKESKEQPQEITASSFRVELDGYSGAWNVIENAEIDGKELFMLENDYYGDSVAYIVADKDGNIVDNNVWGDFEEYENTLVKRRLIEAAEKVEDGTTMPVLKEFAEDMRKYGFETYEADDLFTAKKEDVAGFIYVDAIGEIFYDISEKYRFTPNDVSNNHLLDLNRFHSEYGWNAFSMGKNVFENTVIALCSSNFKPMESYIEQVKSVCENSDGNMLYEKSKINVAEEYLEKFKAVYEEKRKSMFKSEQQFPNGELTDEGETVEITQESNIHFGYFGNGVLCYDTSRLDKEIDDYLSVAHISNEGNIRYYVDDLSESDKQSIENHAKGVKDRFTAYWNELPLLTRYGILYDRLLDTGNVEQIRAFDADRSISDMSEKVKKYEHSIIFRDEDFPVKNSAEISFQEALDDLIREKNKEAVEKIEVGGEITLNNEVYVIKNIDGDFSLSMEKKGDSDADIKRYVGNWKEQLLNEAGDNALFVYSAVLANDLNYINAVNAEKSRTAVLNDEVRDDDFEIFQVKSGDEYLYKRFIDLSSLGQSPSMSDYDLVYKGKLSEINVNAESKDDILNNIYTKFNINHPEDFKGHSLSVSDIVVLHKDGIDTAHYVDDIGFKDVSEFLREKAIEQPHTLSVGDIVTFADRPNVWRVSTINDTQIDFENTDQNSMDKMFSHIDFGQHRDNLQEKLKYSVVSQDISVREINIGDKTANSPMGNYNSEVKETAKAPKPKKFPNTIPHRNFNKLKKLFPELMAKNHTYEHYESGSYEPLSAEWITDNMISLMQTYVQNGDLMRDPDVTFKVDFENETVNAFSYENSGLGIYREYSDGSKGQKDTNSFVVGWLNNIEVQNFKLTRYDDINENRVDLTQNSEQSVLSEEKAYIYSEIKFETGEVYFVPDKISDDNVTETDTYKEILEIYADKDNIESLDDMIRVNIRNFRYGSGEESIPNDKEMTFIRENSIDIMNKSEEIGNTEFFAHFWKNIDDVLNDLESKAAEQHKTSPKFGDGYEEQTYIFPTDFSSDYPDYNGAVREIMVGKEWIETEEAVKIMNAQGNTDTAQIEALRVHTVSFDGIERSEELSPEAFHIILNRTKKNKDKMKEAAELYEKNNGNIMPVYTKTPAEATEAGEKEKYFADKRENERCAASIRYSIGCNNDGMHFNSDKAISELLGTYSIDRIALIIAARVSNSGEWDKRFSRENVEWAKNVVKAYPAEQAEAISHLRLNSHSVLLNSAADELRKNFEIFRSMQNEKETKVTADVHEQRNFNENIKNLSQLKRTLTVGTEFVITDHVRSECVGERRRVTEANTACFYSQKINADGTSEGKPLYMEWGKAANWNFENGVCTSSLDNKEMVMSFKVLEEDMLNIDTAVRSDKDIIDDNNSPMGNSEEERHISAADITIGDRFLYNGNEVTVSSLIGIYPDEIGVSRIEKSGGIEFEVASNVDKFTLAKDGLYLGNAEKSKTEEKAEYTDEPITANEENSKFDEQKIISAFDSLKANNSFSPDAEKFLERTVKQLIVNKAENIDLKMFTSPVFSQHHGTVVRINDKIFDGKLKQIVDEFNGYINENDAKNVNNENLAAEDNSPMGNFDPQISDVIENDDGVYKVANISENYVTLLEIDTLLPDEKMVSMTDFYKSNFTLLERDKSISEAVNKEKSSENKKETDRNAEIPVSKSANYIIKGYNFGDTGGAKSRYAANIEAIKVLKSIEAENRTAAPAEQDILAKYTGWGAISQAFDSDNTKWSSEYAELKELLTPEEYEAARHSTMNAHYTSPTVISAMYDVLNNLGFVKGNILEPAMGTGNFFGMLPELCKDSKLYGVELDSITGRIAQQLYPNADIQVTGYEKTSFPDNSFDVAIGNVPFGDYKISDKRYNEGNFNIHDYFFAKTLDKVHAGGIIAFVTSKGTMDKENDEIRRYIAERAELLGAIRLPNNAFKATAGTEVTSDILILQKRERPIKIKPDSIEWLKKAETADGLSVNNYFVQHPEMVLGKITEGNKLYGNSTKDTSCTPIEGADLKQQLAEAISNIKGTYKAADIEIDPKGKETLPAPANSRKFSFIAKGDSIYYREVENTMRKINVPKDIFNRAYGMIELRDTVHELLNLQLENSLGYLDSKVDESRKKLNTLYDSFVKKYGNISSPKNAKAFKGDNGYFVLSALENKDENGKVIGKADIFTKNTVKPKIIASHVETAEEALILSVSEKGKVDFDFMTELCGMDKDRLISELDGQIYRLPQETEKYVTADEYLTGNIRKKILEIENSENPNEYEKNYNALQAAMPPRVEAKDIAVKLGSHWVDPQYIRQFILEKFKTDARTENELNVSYSKVAGTWKVEGQTATAKTNHTAINTYGTRRKNAYEIIEGILNNSDLLVKDRAKDEFGNDKLDEKGRYILVTNEEETKAVRHCANIIKSEFADWIFKDPDRRNDLVNKYNEIFNSFRYREYDGSHLNFVGMNTDITLKEHQRNAIARGLYGGNTLLAHAVGAGKTYEMIAIAMEGKRLGLHNKSLFAVPNSLTQQIGNDFRKLYPNANILVATKKDFEKENRATLLAKMATNDWDAVIIGHSQFDRMGLSPERESEYLTNEITKLRDELDKMKAENPKSKSFTVKNIEKTITSYTKRLDDLKDKQVKDDFIDFEQLGFDKIFVDECHMYKNLATATKMRNVAGLGSRGSARAFNLFMKAKYLDELTGGKGCIFSSGTPVSNSMTELYTLMRYLQADTLKELGIEHFDEWAADFGEVVTDYELKPESDGKYQLKTRFAKFTNLPELMAIFKQAADIRTADTLDLEKPVSVVKEIVAKPSRIQKRGIKSLGERATAIRLGGVDPRIDNMLCVTNDGRKIGLDQRLINPDLPDDPNSKVNMCVQNVFDIYTQTAEKKSTQCIFCDLSTPKTESRQDRFIIYRPDEESDIGYEIIRKKNGIKKDTGFAAIKQYVKDNADNEEDKLQNGDIAVIRRPNEDNTKIISEAAVFENGKFDKSHSDELLEKLEMSPVEDMPPKEFNIYDDIKNKLMERGVSEKEIAFIHDYDTAEKKQGLFNKMNAGEVRILLGSTSKCGAGMNAQRKMIALHHLDAPMRPSDMEQRNGRIERQGNENPEVQIYRYVTDRTFDAYLYQMLENKQKFISQVMTSKTPERVCADIDEAALDYAEVKALCAGNPLIKEEMELQNKIKDLKMEKSRYSENLYEMQDKIRVKYPEEIRISELINKHNQQDLDTANAAEFIINDEGKKIYPIEIGGVKYTDRKEGGNAIKTALGANIGRIAEGKTVEIGTYRGMKLSVYQNSLSKKVGACLEGYKNHYCELNPETDIGNVVRLDNCINNIAVGIEKTKEEIAAKRADLEVMKIDVEKPFPRADELFKAETRLEEVHIELTKIEQNDDSKEKDLFERLCDDLPEILSGARKSMQFEVLGDVHTVELKGDLLTLTKDDGNAVTETVMQIDYENEKAIPFSVDGMELSAEKEEKNAYFTNINHFFDKLEDNGFNEIKQDVQADRGGISM